MTSKLIYKIIIVGNGGVGKTTFLRKVINKEFIETTKMTIGIDFFVHFLNINGIDITLNLWDFGGQERFEFILNSFVHGAKGALLFYDLSRPQKTLNFIEKWVNLCRHEDTKLPILLVGSKSDREPDFLYKVDIDGLKHHYNLFDHQKISSKANLGIQEPLKKITIEILKNEKNTSFLNSYNTATPTQVPSR